MLHASKLSYSCEPSGEEPNDEASDNKGTIPPRLWLVLSSVQDPMNMGAVLRSAYYLGTEKIVAYNSCHLSPVVSKASAGAMEVFDIHETNDLPKFVSKQKEHGKYVFGSVGKTMRSSGPPPEGDAEDSIMTPTPVTDAVLRKDSLLLIGTYRRRHGCRSPLEQSALFRSCVMPLIVESVKVRKFNSRSSVPITQTVKCQSATH